MKMYVAWQQAHHTEHLDKITVDHIESKLMFVMTSHIHIYISNSELTVEMAYD